MDNTKPLQRLKSQVGLPSGSSIPTPSEHTTTWKVILLDRDRTEYPIEGLRFSTRSEAETYGSQALGALTRDGTEVERWCVKPDPQTADLPFVAEEEAEADLNVPVGKREPLDPAIDSYESVTGPEIDSTLEKMLQEVTQQTQVVSLEQYQSAIWYLKRAVAFKIGRWFVRRRLKKGVPIGWIVETANGWGVGPDLIPLNKLDEAMSWARFADARDAEEMRRLENTASPNREPSGS